jgi:predicted transcriptional regulator
MKLFDSELKILDILWQEGDTTAKRLAEILLERVQWSKTTTYTVIKKCIDKGAVSRQEPNFVCRATITREQVQETETNELINKMYGGMPDQLVASILWRNDLSPEEIERLKDLINMLT